MTAPLQLRDYACAKVRRRLDSYLIGELSVDLSHEILEHLDRCLECGAEARAREKLRATVRRVAAATPGPRDGLEGEVRALLARTPMRRPVAGSLLLAASLLAAAGMTGWLVLSRTASPEASKNTGATVLDAPALDASAADLVALEHRNCARAASWPREAASSEAFTSGVEAPLAAAAQAAAARLPGYAPVSAHECGHAGETIFHIILRRRGDESKDGLVSVVVTRPLSALAARAKVTEVLAASSRLGFSVAGARVKDGRLVLVAGSADGRAALEIGRAVLPAFATAVAVP
ncbi:MAG: zf-HC2 domain-containing protein [Thermoanaerobaculia bacterium]|nr:zf-HC2 domain-containing protein [Thermoanaerobaculia bacterium]